MSCEGDEAPEMSICGLSTGGMGSVTAVRSGDRRIEGTPSSYWHDITPLLFWESVPLLHILPPNETMKEQN